MPFVSVITPCYNEEGNVEELYARVKAVMDAQPGYRYEHIFIDNASKDRTVSLLRGLAARDPAVKVIVNVRNFGHIRSPYHGLLQASGEAAIFLACDLQDPPELIATFLRHWEAGSPIVLGVKTTSAESAVMFAVRSAYYDTIARISDIELTKNSTGFGLYSRRVIQVLREVQDPYPYFRGLIADLGFESVKVPFSQPTRKRGITKNNFYTLYDMAMLGITNHSKVPLRVATFTGFTLSLLCLFAAFAYLVAKLLFWNYFSMGQAPLLIGLFFFASIQLFFTGILGEYIGAIHTQVQNRPLVIEKERINFTAPADSELVAHLPAAGPQETPAADPSPPS